MIKGIPEQSSEGNFDGNTQDISEYITDTVMNIDRQYSLVKFQSLYTNDSN